MQRGRLVASTRALHELAGKFLEYRQGLLGSLVTVQARRGLETRIQ
jgi:hypothetical protein